MMSFVKKGAAASPANQGCAFSPDGKKDKLEKNPVKQVFSKKLRDESYHLKACKKGRRWEEKTGRRFSGSDQKQMCGWPLGILALSKIGEK